MLAVFGEADCVSRKSLNVGDQIRRVLGAEPDDVHVVAYPHEAAPRAVRRFRVVGQPDLPGSCR
jgi:hypothetical protein